MPVSLFRSFNSVKRSSNAFRSKPARTSGLKPCTPHNNTLLLNRSTPLLRSKIQQISPSFYVKTSLNPIFSVNTHRYLCTQSKSTTEPETVAPIENEPALPSKTPIPFVPLAITAISLVPFVATAIIPFAFPFEIAGKAVFMQMTYGAAALSFWGSVHWGLAMGNYKRNDSIISQEDAQASQQIVVPSKSDQVLRYLGGVLPALAAWIFMTQPPLYGMIGLMSAFTALFLFESGAHKARLTPSWYIRLRMPWTTVVLFSLGLNLMQML